MSIRLKELEACIAYDLHAWPSLTPAGQRLLTRIRADAKHKPNGKVGLELACLLAPSFRNMPSKTATDADKRRAARRLPVVEARQQRHEDRVWKSRTAGIPHYAGQRRSRL
ncbi:MAG: hypothetical protein AAB410_00075 [Patescibacteria group bacterium]